MIKMSKAELLAAVYAHAGKGGLTAQELQEAFEQGVNCAVCPDDAGAYIGPRHGKVPAVLANLGAIIIMGGIAAITGQYWGDFDTALRVLVTLGAGLMAYSMAFVFECSEKTRRFAKPFFWMSALLIPCGVGVALHEAGIRLDGMGTQTLGAAGVCAVYGLAFAFTGSHTALLLSIFAATSIWFCGTQFVVEGSWLQHSREFFHYRLLLCGAMYITGGWLFSRTRLSSLSGILYFLGAPILLSAGMLLGDYKPDQKIVWEVAYPSIAVGLMLISIPLHSKSCLTWGAIFLGGFVAKITAEYFSQSMGWPLALIVTGTAVTGIALATASLARAGKGGEDFNPGAL